ncbi:MAG: methyltransferase family protein [Gemmatimonadota bacterium]
MREVAMLEDLGFRVALLAVLGAGLAVSGALRRRADRAGGEVPRSADEKPVRVALVAGAVLFYGALVAWLVHPELVGWGSVPVAEPVRWSGAVLLAAGVALALWALTHLGRNVTPTAVAREDAELVTTGPYARVRHPLYSSMLLTLPGCALLAANLVVLIGGVVTFAAILVRVRREEEELVGRFGERYVAYAERTGRVLPRLGRSE